MSGEGRGDAPSLRESLTPEFNQTAAVWRRGMMHAVERIDRVMSPRQQRPRTLKALNVLLDAIDDELDLIAAFQRRHGPQTYEQAFRLCEDELARAEARQKARKNGSSQQTSKDPTQ